MTKPVFVTSKDQMYTVHFMQVGTPTTIVPEVKLLEAKTFASTLLNPIVFTGNLLQYNQQRIMSIYGVV